MKNPAVVHNSRNRSPSAARALDYRVSQHTGFIFEEDDAESTPKAQPATPALPSTPRYNPPRRSIILDQWAALGERRRAAPTPTPTPAPTPAPATVPTKQSHSPPQTTPTDGAFGANVPPRKRNRAGSWRRNLNWHTFERKKDTVNKEPWSVSKDWRRHPSTPAQPSTSVEKRAALEWVWRSGGLLHL
jgi:hypothetical protein